jgi:penicillin-binding protein 1B
MKGKSKIKSKKFTKRVTRSGIKISRPFSKSEKFFRLFLTISFFSLIFGTIGAFYLFKQTKQFVQNNLESLISKQTSGIFSEPFMAFNGQKFTKEAILRQLEKRAYSQVQTEPKEIGEFQINDGILLINTRAFLQPNGQIRNAAKIVYNFNSGEIRNQSEIGRDELILEPILISSLTNSEEKVSKYYSLSSMPPYLPKAFLAIEDARFYKHIGVDPIGILRALLTNIKAGRVVQGGSTITQQLAKNMFFTSEKSYLRKIKEAFAALALEQLLNKDKILELYLNEVYFGRDGAVSVHGVAEAANSYFDKTLENISLAESALLAGLVKAPSSYALRKNLSKAKERQNLVLAAMQSEDFITEKEKLEALNFEIKISTTVKHKKLAPYFIYQVQQELSKAIDIETATSSGLSVFTGIDREFQRCGENALISGLEKLEKTHPSLKRKNQPLEAALVSIEPYSGLIKSWVGGRDFGQNQFNHVIQAKRQIGSTIKPFVYLTALSPEFNDYKVATPISILADEPISIKVPSGNWSPENYDKKFRGDVTLRYALENSLNIPAVYVSQKVGISKVASVLESFKVSNTIQPVPALALGATESTLLDMTAAYAALANGGTYVNPRLFSTVLTRDGNLAMSTPAEEKKVADEASVTVLTNLMRGVVERGTAKGIRSGGYIGPVAGKTGTTNDARDAWFIGFTPNLATGVWVGFDDNKKIGLTGGSAAVPIWTEYMNCISPFLEQNEFVNPKTVKNVIIDANTNLQNNPECPSDNTYSELFVLGTEPEMLSCGIDYSEQPVTTNEFTDENFDYQGSNESSETIAEKFEKESRIQKGFWENLFR